MSDFIRYKDKYPFSDTRQDKFYPFRDEVRRVFRSDLSGGYNPQSQMTAPTKVNLRTNELSLSPYVNSGMSLQDCKDRFEILNTKIRGALADYTDAHSACVRLFVARTDTIHRIDFNRQLLVASVQNDQIERYANEVATYEYVLSTDVLSLEESRRHRASIYKHIDYYLSEYTSLGQLLATTDTASSTTYQEAISSMTSYYENYALDDSTDEILSVAVDATRCSLFLLNNSLIDAYENYRSVNNELKLLVRERDSLAYDISIMDPSNVTPAMTERLSLLEDSVIAKTVDVLSAEANATATEQDIDDTIDSIITNDTVTNTCVSVYNVSKEWLMSELRKEYSVIDNYVKRNRI